MASLGYLLGVALFLVFVLPPALLVGYAFARFANLPERVGMLTVPLGVDRWAGLPPTLLFLAGLGWLTAAGTLPDEGEGGYNLAMAALAGAAVGLFGVAVALGNLGRYRQVASGDVASGGVESVGAETAEAPFSGEDCLAWAVRVREHSGPFRRGSPPPVHEAAGGVPFAVSTATERVTVDPTAARLRVWSPLVGSGPDFTARERDGAPERAERFAAGRGLASADDSRVYEEVRVEAGDPVTVVGATDGGGLSVLGGGSPLVIPRPAETVRARFRRRVLAGPAGALLAVGSFLVAAVVSGAL